MSARDELADMILDSSWRTSEQIAEEILAAGYRKIFDGDCGLSNATDREASEAWMRWANLAMNDAIGAIGAMKQMLTEFGYRKPKVIQYMVVTQDGGLYDCSFGLDRERAQAVAEQATADAATVGLTYTYRVAEVIEPEAQS